MYFLRQGNVAEREKSCSTAKFSWGKGLCAGPSALALPSLIVTPMKWEKCVGWGQEPGRCEETIQNSSPEQAPFEEKLKAQKGSLSFFLCLAKIRKWEIF